MSRTPGPLSLYAALGVLLGYLAARKAAERRWRIRGRLLVFHDEPPAPLS